MAAKESKLGELHEFLAEQFMIEGMWYRENDIPMPAADKAAMSKFLKDNNITCDPADRSDLEALKAEFLAGSKARQSKAAQAAGLSADDLATEYGMH